MFVTNSFTFYNGASPRQALHGRQPACPPDLPTDDYDQETGTSDDPREQRMREIPLAANAHVATVANTNMTPRVKTKTTRASAPPRW
eukprot:9040937-Pyramimonas_sp.AAC.1